MFNSGADIIEIDGSDFSHIKDCENDGKVQALRTGRKAILNLYSHDIDFLNGFTLKPAFKKPAFVSWDTKKIEEDDLLILKKKPYLSFSEKERLDGIIKVINKTFIKYNAFLLVSFPVIRAGKGTVLEDKIGGVVKMSRENKIAYLDKFYRA